MPKSSKLHCPWVFWLDRWTVVDGENTHIITDLGEASTAREFWSLLNHNPVDALAEDSSIHVFRKNVKPEWEDPQNANGGHFRFMNVKSDVRNESKIWDALLLHTLSEDFQLASSICGVGFSHKRQNRKVVSLWLNTTDVSVIRSIQAELSPHISDNYLVRFVAHSTLRRSEFTALQNCQHRRIQSAPNAAAHHHHTRFVSVDFDVPEPQDDAIPRVATAAAAATSSTTSSPEATISGRKVRRAPSPLKHGLKTDSATTDEELHHRSKSASEATEVIPHMAALMRSRNGTPPPGTNNPLSRSADGDASGDIASSTASSGVYPSMKAPTPLKVWADQWSPSMLYAALGVKPPAPFPTNDKRAAAAGATSGSKPPMPTRKGGQAKSAPQTAVEVAVAPPSEGGGGGAAAAAGGDAAAQGDNLGGSGERPRQTKSDAPPFVHAGWLFPAGLNRKERRRIAFSGEVDPSTYPGATFVGEDYQLPPEDAGKAADA